MMMECFLRFAVLVSLLKLSHQASTIGSSVYLGAVVEYHALTTGRNGKTIAEKNANNYLTIIEKASKQKVDIIVFPETGLTPLRKTGPHRRKYNATEFRNYYVDVASYVPNPKDHIVPCDSGVKYKLSLRTISCAAREHQMYIVVNHHELADCLEPICTPDDFLLYNTNVVFDRNGTVIARYRKYNLYNEAGTNKTAQPEYSTFTTDFGVTFGTFICADILHEKPATFYVNNPEVTDVIFTTHWLDELPFLDAVQYQAAWSYAADVNFLASAFSDETTASGGSGIYGGRNGPIKIHQPRETSNAIIVVAIPKVDRRRKDEIRPYHTFVYEFSDYEIPTIFGHTSRHELYPAFYHDDLRPYTTQVLDLTQKSHITRLCDRGLCCDFHVEIIYDSKIAVLPNSTQYTYRFVVFNGIRNVVNVTTGGLEVCGIVACAGDRIEDCGSLFLPKDWVIQPTIFDKLMITRIANLDQQVLYAPSTLTTGRRWPLSGEGFAYLTSGHRNSSLLLMYLVRPRSNIMTFAIYGRRYDRDGRYVTRPSRLRIVESRIFLTGIIAASVMVCFYFWMRT